MSTIVVVKEASHLVLGADSRFMRLDFSGPLSSSMQKVFEVARDTFIATSGRLRACEFQTRTAREIAAELATTDVRVIGAALAERSIPVLTQLVGDMIPFQHVHEGIGQAVTGQALSAWLHFGGPCG